MRPIEIEPRCPQCGTKLLVEIAGTEPEPHDRALCPVHGDVGSVEEAARAALEQNRDKIGDQVADHIKDILRKAGL